MRPFGACSSKQGAVFHGVEFPAHAVAPPMIGLAVSPVTGDSEAATETQAPDQRARAHRVQQ